MVLFENSHKKFAMKECIIPTFTEKKQLDRQLKMLEDEFNNTYASKHPGVVEVYSFNKNIAGANYICTMILEFASHGDLTNVSGK